MKKNKLFKSFLILIMMIGVFATVNNISVEEIKAATNAADAPDDWAFTEDSIPLHDGLLANHKLIDTGDGKGGAPDGYISISEANSFSASYISVNNKGLTGTIDGIEHFTSVDEIALAGNRFTGVIPESIGNLTNLKILNLSDNSLSGNIPNSLYNLKNLSALYLGANQFTGEISESIGQLNKLERIYMQNNQISGSIPVSIGTIDSLQVISLYNNQLTGNIPESIGSLSKLYNLGLNDNQLSGDIPKSMANLSELTRLNIFGNYNLTGNIAELFKGHSKIECINIKDTQIDIEKPQTATSLIFIYGSLNLNADNVRDGFDSSSLEALKEELNALKASSFGTLPFYTSVIEDLEQEIIMSEEILAMNGLVDDLFNSDKTDLADNTTMKNITDVEDVVNAMSDGAAKDRLLNEVELAKNMLMAKEAVDGLFKDETHTTIIDSLEQKDIDNAQNLVNKLEYGPLKEELQVEIDEAQRLFNEREAQKAVDDLFDDEDILNDDVTQDDIKNAQDLVNKLPEGDLKNELNDRLKDAQKQLDERNFVIIEAFRVFTGEGTVYTKIDAPVEKFTRVYVDGKELDASNYEVTSGSTVITLTEAYLKTLENGTYDVDVEFTSGAVVSTELTVKVTFTHPSITPPATTNPTPGTPTVSKPSTDVGSTTNSSSVNTSDATDLTGLYAMLALSILGIVVIRKRKEA